jgi:hypothetical protein
MERFAPDQNSQHGENFAKHEITNPGTFSQV